MRSVPQPGGARSLRTQAHSAPGRCAALPPVAHLDHPGFLCLLLLLAALRLSAGTPSFQRQVIVLPVNADGSGFLDVDNNGRADLLAVDDVRKTLWIYRQRASGFPDVPDEALALPPQTGWIAPCDVDPHPGLEMLFSTAAGLSYHRQHGGAFEPELRPLLQASQPFTESDAPILMSFPTNTIPIIATNHVVLYRRDSAFGWRPGQTFALKARPASCRSFPSRWFLGQRPASSFNFEQSFLANPDPDDKPANQAVQKVMEEMKKADPLSPPVIHRLDIDRDGREDLVIWQILGQVDPKTDICLFLRGADGQLPNRPTQILRCRGVPFPVGSTSQPCPVGDLKGNGAYEIALLELKAPFTSVSGAIETLVSRGLNWNLTIRRFHERGFSRSPDATVPLITIIPVVADQWPFFICGDFNRDGRPDLVIRRSATQWSITISSDDGRWFVPEAALSFETPFSGYFTTKDLNGDGRSDLILRAWNDPRLVVYLTEPSPAKGEHK